MPHAWQVVPFVPLQAGARQWFSYRAPRGRALRPGQLVRIPFGPRAVEGLVWRPATRAARVPLKSALSVTADEPLFLPAELHALERLADASLESLPLLAKAAAGVRRVGSGTAGAALRVPPSQQRARGGAPLRPRVSWGSPKAVLPKRTVGQLLLLVPELALGRLILAALERQKLPVVLFAQGLGVRERRAVVERLLAGEPLAVVATHAGVFLPFPALEGITVIEAALPSHRQWDLHPRYDARVAAVLLARERGVPLTLQSSLPSLDLLRLEKIQRKSKNEKRKTSLLPSSPAPPLPHWQIIPRSSRDPLLLPDTLKTIRDTVAGGGRALLFHDVVGAERVFACESCGHTLRCAQCNGLLERHHARSDLDGKRSDLGGGRLACRVCSLPAGNVPHFCPRCKSPHLGPRRVGTATVAQDLQRALPGGTIVRADRETLPRSGARPPAEVAPASVTVATERSFAALGDRRYDLVVVVDADQLLQDLSPDADERFLQVVTRLGSYGTARAAYLLHTTHPHLRSVQALARGDLGAWAESELEDRALLGFPPSAAALRLEQHFPAATRAGRALQRANSQLLTLNPQLRVGTRLSGLPPRVRAEILLRGSLSALRSALPSLPAGWSTDPIVPLSSLLSS